LRNPILVLVLFSSRASGCPKVGNSASGVETTLVTSPQQEKGEKKARKDAKPRTELRAEKAGKEKLQVTFDSKN
jgi:hypothetical protein